MKSKGFKRGAINHTALKDIVTTTARRAWPDARPHFPPVRLLASPFAFATLASALLLPQSVRAADAPGGGPLIVYGGVGGAGNGHGGGDGGTNNGLAGTGGNGGAGGSGTPGGAVGTNTNAASFTAASNLSGGNGSDSPPGAGAGGGGSGLYAGSTSITVNSGIAVTGGNGGTAADNNGAGGGGGGGTGLASTANAATITNLGTITGGAGGAGGGGLAGGGGGGGDGVLATGGAVTLTNSGVITGGTGGRGGDSTLFGYPGASGVGGAGVDLMAGGNTINNSGSIAGSNSTASSINNAGGAGIVTFGSDVINNSGSISGGLAGDGATRADAIQFNGTGNKLNILSGAASMTGALELTTGASAAIQAQAAGATISSAIILRGSDSALTFDTSSALGLTVSGAISGSGTIGVVGGAATIILTGNNSYSGATTIDGSSRLQIGNGGTSGTLGSGAVTNDGALSFNRSDTLLVGNPISGGGTLTQAGSGTTVLSGANTYTGATTISAGTLQVGNGGATGTLGTAGVTNDGVLAFNRSDTVTIGNLISGTGALSQAGSGTTILTAANTYGGTTSVSAGTLQVGDGGTTGAVSNNVSIGAGGALAFKRSDIVTYGGIFSGGGTLRQTGSGMLILTGNSSGFTGTTSVSAGTLRANGTLSGALAIGAGATVDGTGTVGATTVGSGGTLSAGTAGTTGTLNVNGNLIFNSGSNYLVDIAGAGGNDRLAATGVATLTGGTVKVNALDAKANYHTGQTYTLLSAAGGLGGTTFAGATTSSGFLGLALGYTATTATLNITVTGSFAEAADTRNQRATGGALDTLAANGASLALYNKLLALSSGDARSAFNMLDGEIHASLKTGLLGDSGFVRDAFVNRLRIAGEDDNPGPVASARAEQGLWFSGYGGWNKYGGDSPNAGALKGSTGGMMLGYDRMFAGTWRAGVAAGYGNSSYKVDERASSSKVDSYTLGAYAGTKMGNVHLRFGAANTWHSVDSARSSSFPGFFETNEASYKARTTQVFGEAGYGMHWRGTTLEPYLGLAYVNLHSDGYSESGTAGLQGQDGDDRVTYGTLGARLTTPVRVGTIAGSLRAGLGWRHADGDTQPTVTQAFSGSGDFTVSGVPIARDAAIVEAGLDLPLARNANLSVSYGGQVVSHAWQHGLAANVRVWF